MAKDKRAAEAEGDQGDQDDSLHAMIGYGDFVALRIDCLGAVVAGMQKSVFQSPVFGEVHPSIVFLFPAVVTKLANRDRRKLSFG